MKEDLTKILNFLKRARGMQEVFRKTPKLKGNFENDAEHSWSVSLSCMILMEELKKEFGPNIDELKILKMAIIHDLAEIETGDTATWDIKARVGKDEREKEAIENLTNLLPSELKNGFLKLWEECENRETIESKIVKSIDRLDPILQRNSFNLGWDNIEKGHETLEALDTRQLERHSFSKTLTSFYKLLRKEAVDNNLVK